MQPTPRIVVIGAGFSGTMVAANLLKSAQSSINLTLIERRGELARGIAYSTSTLSHLLNVPASNMSAWPDKPNHLVEWLQQHEEDWNAMVGARLTSSSFIPRKIYGRYLQTILREAEQSASFRAHFKKIHADAISISMEGAAYRIGLKDGESIAADTIVLALGNFQPANPNISPSIIHSQSYFRDPWSSEALASLQEDKPLLLVGTGLTMVDLALSLREREFKGKIYAVSRHGLIPESHADYTPVTFPKPQIHSLKALLKEVRERAKNAPNWRSAIDTLRPHNQILWASLSHSDQKRFLRHLKAYWDVHRHRIAPQVHHTIEQMRQEGTLVIETGRLDCVYETREGLDAILSLRGTQDKRVLRVQRIINCTGPSYRSLHLSEPLLHNLFEQGLLRPHPVLGIDATTDGRLIDRQGSPSRRLFTLGSLLTGVLWETIAVPELRQQARAIAAHINEAITGGLLSSKTTAKTVAHGNHSLHIRNRR